MRARSWLLAVAALLAVCLAGCSQRAPEEPPEPAVSSPGQSQTAAASTAKTGAGSTTATEAAEETGPLIVAFGDSITFGEGLTRKEAYPAQLERVLRERGYPHRVLNAGHVGLGTDRALAPLNAALANKPDILLLGLGTRDILAREPAEKVRERLDKLILRVKETDTQLVLVGMNLKEDYYQMYQDLATKHQVALVPDLLKGVIEKRDELMLNSVHCNAKGCSIAAEQNVLPVILPLLKK